MNSNFDFSLRPGRNLAIREYKEYKKVISVITPAYNTSAYIFETANCILNQTYPYFEWLIIDDGSTDKKSLEILKKVEKMDKRIKVLHKENEGLSKTRDYGVKNSSKETNYVVFIDDDDLLDKTYLEMSYYTMETNKEAAWCYCDVVNFEGEEYLWNKAFSSEKMKKENLLVSQAMVRKSAFYDVGGFALEGNGHYEDWIFWLKLLSKGYYPIHMSYYGFWYRRKTTSSQLKVALARHKENMEEIKEYAHLLKGEIFPIEFPRENYNWDGITEKIDSLVYPKYKENKKTKLLVIVPWMMLGGADKFNLDLFKLLPKEKYFITFVTTQPTSYVWRQKFEGVCDEVFDLSTFLDRKDWFSFVDYLIETRNTDIVFNTNSVTGYMMLPLIKATHPELPILDYIHMEEWYNRNGGYSRDSASVTSVIDKTLFCNANSVRIMHEYFKVDQNKLGTIYIGVDASKFDPKKYNKTLLRKKYEIPEDKFVMSLIARIDYQKRPFLMMKIIEKLVATREIPTLLFVVAGDGPLLEEVKSIAIKKGLNDYIKFLGVSKTPDEIYAISDVTLNCSIKEGLALTAYESLSMGVPVVSSDVGGQKELIDEKTGVIVPCLQSENDILNFHYSEEEIMNYVNGIIKVYKENTSYKKHCRKRILDGFTIQNMAILMDREFDQVLKKKKEDFTDFSKHKNIYKELLNQYFLGNKEEYSWFCKEYYKNVYQKKDEFSLKSKIKSGLWKIPGWKYLTKTKAWRYVKNKIKG